MIEKIKVFESKMFVLIAIVNQLNILNAEVVDADHHRRHGIQVYKGDGIAPCGCCEK